MRLKRFEDLLGQTLTRATVNEARDCVVFTLSDGSSYDLSHGQDCCETVEIEGLDGDIEDGVFVDLVGEVVLAAESSRKATSDEVSESGTWTFYRIGTTRGTVIMRWLGQSNGYYSEAVSFGPAK